MLGDHCHPSVPMDQIVANELEILGSHGIQAHKFDDILRMISSGKLQPKKLIGKMITLEDSLQALVEMDNFDHMGVTVINQF